jgi:hypothetical protein
MKVLEFISYDVVSCGFVKGGHVHAEGFSR